MGGIGLAMSCFFWSTMVRMIAELASAHRDIARNSFRH
jgi:hypothetical protein